MTPKLLSALTPAREARYAGEDSRGSASLADGYRHKLVSKTSRVHLCREAPTYAIASTLYYLA